MRDATPEGGFVMMESKTARNPEQHDLYWALCDLVAFQTDTTKRAVSDWLLTKTNMVDMLFYPDGEMQLRPKSIAWESMEQTEFDEFFQRAVPLIADLLGSAPKEVLQCFYDLLDKDTRAATIKRLRRALRKVESVPLAPEQPTELTDCQGEQVQ